MNESLTPKKSLTTNSSSEDGFSTPGTQSDRNGVRPEILVRTPSRQGKSPKTQINET